MDSSLDTFAPDLDRASMEAAMLPAPPGLAGVSPLQLADHLIALAQDAEQAGFADAARELVELVYAVLDRSTIQQPPNSRSFRD